MEPLPDTAPLILANQTPFSFLDIYDDKGYVLRCTEGEFKGRFLFINMISGGELFGSADPEENLDITMYIENSGLSPFHASIQFIDSKGKPLGEDGSSQWGHYLLTDHNSKTGTWASVEHSYAEHQNWMLPRLEDTK